MRENQRGEELRSIGEREKGEQGKSGKRHLSSLKLDSTGCIKEFDFSRIISTQTQLADFEKKNCETRVR